MALLEVQGVRKSFGGLHAIRDVSFNVEPGQIVGLIGPNGAGKTTIFNLITGFDRPAAGCIRFQGRDLSGMKPHRICRLGLVRTFQLVKPFTSLTVLENVMIPLLPQLGSVDAARREAVQYVEFVGLAERRDVVAQGLSTGQRKRLELARAMATNAKMLLLDEVTGGVDRRSIPGLVELVRRLRDEGSTLLVIEHHMDILHSLCDRVVALHLGAVVTEGDPRTVVSHPTVVEAFLGTSRRRAADTSAGGPGAQV